MKEGGVSTGLGKVIEPIKNRITRFKMTPEFITRMRFALFMLAFLLVIWHGVLIANISDFLDKGVSCSGAGSDYKAILGYPVIFEVLFIILALVALIWFLGDGFNSKADDKEVVEGIFIPAIIAVIGGFIIYLCKDIPACAADGGFCTSWLWFGVPAAILFSIAVLVAGIVINER